LVLEVLDKDLLETAKLVSQVMESAYKLDIPLLTEARSGINWGSMEVIQN